MNGAAMYELVSLLMLGSKRSEPFARLPGYQIHLFSVYANALSFPWGLCAHQLFRRVVYLLSLCHLSA